MDQAVVLNEVSQVKSSVEDLKQVVNHLTKIMVNSFSPSQTIPGMSCLMTNLQTPMNSTVTKNHTQTTQTKSVKRKLPESAKKREGDHNNLVKQLFSPNEDEKTFAFYMNHQPINTSKYILMEEHQELTYLRPPKDMILDEVEAAVAAYIFGSNMADVKSGKEVLIKCSWGHGNRETLKSLIPKNFMDQEVLNLLACSLTHKERSIDNYSTHWFLPTNFAQFVLGWKKTPQTIMGYYQKSSRIYVPINDENVHWYLLVVDMIERPLILLDSKPCPTRKEWRKRHVKKLALFLEEMMLDNSFYERKSYLKPLISEFNLIVPDDIGEKINGFDCRVWVAHWMKITIRYLLSLHQGCVLPLICHWILTTT